MSGRAGGGEGGGQQVGEGLSLHQDLSRRSLCNVVIVIVITVSAN